MCDLKKWRRWVVDQIYIGRDGLIKHKLPRQLQTDHEITELAHDGDATRSLGLLVNIGLTNEDTLGLQANH